MRRLLGECIVPVTLGDYRVAPAQSAPQSPNSRRQGQGSPPV